MEIRKAGPADLDAVEKSYCELLSGEGENPSNWILGVYPTRAWAEENLEGLYVLMEGETFGASMILNQNQPEDYQNVPWAFPGEKKDVWVIHTLCVSPCQGGRGYGRAMVEFAEKTAAEMGGKCLRLDTFVGNSPARGLYTARGFRLAGESDVVHLGLIPEKQVFFEKSLE